MTIIVDCSIYESHRVGQLFSHLMYELFPDSKSMLSLIEYGGCPHDGGEHTFWCKGTKEDVVTFLTLVWETYRGWQTILQPLDEYDQLKEFIDEITNDTTNKRTHWFRQFVNKNYLLTS